MESTEAQLRDFLLLPTSAVLALAWSQKLGQAKPKVGLSWLLAQPDWAKSQSQWPGPRLICLLYRPLDSAPQPEYSGPEQPESLGPTQCRHTTSDLWTLHCCCIPPFPSFVLSHYLSSLLLILHCSPLATVISNKLFPVSWAPFATTFGPFCHCVPCHTFIFFLPVPVPITDLHRPPHQSGLQQVIPISCAPFAAVFNIIFCHVQPLLLLHSLSLLVCIFIAFSCHCYWSVLFPSPQQTPTSPSCFLCLISSTFNILFCCIQLLFPLPSLSLVHIFPTFSCHFSWSASFPSP